MSNKYVSPNTNLTAFNCPHCGVLAQQFWHYLYIELTKHTPPLHDIPPVRYETITRNYNSRQINTPPIQIQTPKYPFNNTCISSCYNCNQKAIWINKKMIYPFPNESSAPLPCENMPEEIKNIFTEARTIVDLSPKSAAALLRLALEKLLIHQGVNGKNLFEGIQKLITEKKLPEMIEQAANIIRHVGNNALHSGEIDLTDNIQTANTLFELINVIIDYTITKPQTIHRMHQNFSKKQQSNE